MTETNEKYFERIYHATYKDISAYVICRVRNVDAAGDILQNTYISFWGVISRGRRLPEAECAPYLKTVSRHEAGSRFISEKKLGGESLAIEDFENELVSSDDPKDVLKVKAFYCMIDTTVFDSYEGEANPNDMFNEENKEKICLLLQNASVFRELYLSGGSELDAAYLLAPASSLMELTMLNKIIDGCIK